MNNQIDFEKLCSKNPLFQGINKDEARTVMGCLGGYIKKYDKDNFVILEQDKVKAIGIILKGTVQMIKEDVWANKTVIAVMFENDLLGETFACGREPYASTVSFQAMCKTEILFLPFDRVLHSCSNSCIFHHKLTKNMVGLIAEKNMLMINKVNIMSQKTLREKISAYLSDQVIKTGKMYFDIPLGRVHLAEYLGADRSALTRELNYMKEEGLIDFDKNTFRVLKKLYE